jgi:hypothetical protein
MSNPFSFAHCDAAAAQARNSWIHAVPALVAALQEWAGEQTTRRSVPIFETQEQAVKTARDALLNMRAGGFIHMAHNVADGSADKNTYLQQLRARPDLSEYLDTARGAFLEAYTLSAVGAGSTATDFVRKQLLDIALQRPAAASACTLLLWAEQCRVDGLRIDQVAAAWTQDAQSAFGKQLLFNLAHSGAEFSVLTPMLVLLAVSWINGRTTKQPKWTALLHVPIRDNHDLEQLVWLAWVLLLFGRHAIDPKSLLAKLAGDERFSSEWSRCTVWPGYKGTGLVLMPPEYVLVPALHFTSQRHVLLARLQGSQAAQAVVPCLCGILTAMPTSDEVTSVAVNGAAILFSLHPMSAASQDDATEQLAKACAAECDRWVMAAFKYRVTDNVPAAMETLLFDDAVQPEYNQLAVIIYALKQGRTVLPNPVAAQPASAFVEMDVDDDLDDTGDDKAPLVRVPPVDADLGGVEESKHGSTMPVQDATEVVQAGDVPSNRLLAMPPVSAAFTMVDVFQYNGVQFMWVGRIASQLTGAFVDQETIRMRVVAPGDRRQTPAPPEAWDPSWS